MCLHVVDDIDSHQKELLSHGGVYDYGDDD
jgi:hypothetical protein